MIVLPVIGMFLAGAAQVERPSVLPPLATRPHGDPARAAGIAAADAGCAVKGVVPGRPVPARLRRAAPVPARIRILHPGDQLLRERRLRFSGVGLRDRARQSAGIHGHAYRETWGRKRRISNPSMPASRYSAI